MATPTPSSDALLNPDMQVRIEDLAQRFCDATLDTHATYQEALGACGTFITMLLLAAPIDCRMESCMGFLQAIAGDVADSTPDNGRYDA